MSFREVGSRVPTCLRAAAIPSLLDLLMECSCVCHVPLTPSLTCSGAGTGGTHGLSCRAHLWAACPAAYQTPPPLSAHLPFPTLRNRAPGPKGRSRGLSLHGTLSESISHPAAPGRGHVESNEPSPKKDWFLGDEFA